MVKAGTERASIGTVDNTHDDLRLPDLPSSRRVIAARLGELIEPPGKVGDGLAAGIREQRAVVLAGAYAAHPRRGRQCPFDGVADHAWSRHGGWTIADVTSSSPERRPPAVRGTGTTLWQR